MSYQPPTAICVDCEEPFLLWSPSDRCPRCNQRRRGARRREKERNLLGRPLIITHLTCECGVEFSHNQYNATPYCPDCNIKYRHMKTSKMSAYRRKMKRREIYDSRVAAVKALLARPDSDPDS